MRNSNQMRRKTAYHHGELAQALVRAAMSQAAAGGVDSITMRAVAQRVGVTPAAAYHHFTSKEHLLAACAERAFAALLERFDAIMTRSFASALDRFEAVGRAYVAHALAHPAHFRIMFGSHMLDVADVLAAESAGRRARQVFEDAAAAVATELGAGVTTLQVIQVGWSGMVGVIMLVLERELGPEMDTAAIDAMIDTVMRALRAGLHGLGTR